MKTRKNKGGGWFSNLFSSAKTNADTVGTKYVDAANTRVFDSLSTEKSPYDKNGDIDKTVYTAADYANYNGIGSTLDDAEVNEINREIDNEITTGTNSDDVINADMHTAASYEGKIRKSLVSAIAAYNLFEKTKDQTNPMYALKKVARSKSKCGTVTCKARGKKIKNALIELLKLNEGALGNLGILGTVVPGAVNYGKDLVNQGVNSINKNIDATKSFMAERAAKAESDRKEQEERHARISKQYAEQRLREDPVATSKNKDRRPLSYEPPPPPYQPPSYQSPSPGPISRGLTDTSSWNSDAFGPNLMGMGGRRSRRRTRR